MRSQYQLTTSSGQEIEIYLASPHQFFLAHQQQLLPNWNTPATYLILFLQRSSISLKELNLNVTQEKDRLRENFIRCGCELIFSLQDQGYQSDLFDPRTGHPLLSQPGKLTIDDNAVARALLNFSVTSYKECSLLTHPIWNHGVYPATIATTAPQNLLTSLIQNYPRLSGNK